MLRASRVCAQSASRLSAHQLALATRSLSSRQNGQNGHPDRLDEAQQKIGLNPRPGGLPEWIELWGVKQFHRFGILMGGISTASVPLAMGGHIAEASPFVLGALTAGYWWLGLRDIATKSHTLRRNFPVLIHMRCGGAHGHASSPAAGKGTRLYFLEGIRPEIQQYLIEPEDNAAPYSRAMRNTIYQRAKMKVGTDTHSLGTRRDVYKPGYEWASHSMFPAPMCSIEESRVQIGGDQVTQKYSASLLNISAMSYGALSGNAISALNLGAKAGGFYHNTGEGGISKYHLLGADVVWNVGTGYFACGKTVAGGQRVFDPDLFIANATKPEIKMIEVKLSQGAKPSHGGILPAAKITETIAHARGLGPPPWTDCISPPRHSAFQTPSGLMRFVARLRELAGGKPVGFKLCVGQPSELAALCHAMLDTGITPDFITVDGGEGGTGAAPSEFQDSLGMPARDGLRLLNSLLIGCNLRDKVTIIVAGKVYSGFSLVRMLAHGADVCNSARSMMFALGCIQALKCNANTCPTGITTQRADLESGLDVHTKSIRVANYHEATIHSALEIVAAMGCRTPREVSPEHLYRRSALNGYGVETYADLQVDAYFAKLKPGSLLDGTDSTASGADSTSNVPPHFRHWWDSGRELHQRLGDEKLAF